MAAFLVGVVKVVVGERTPILGINFIQGIYCAEVRVGVLVLNYPQYQIRRDRIKNIVFVHSLSEKWWQGIKILIFFPIQ